MASNNPVSMKVVIGEYGSENVVAVNDDGSINVSIAQPAAYSFARLTADGQVKGGAGTVHTVTVSPTGSVTAGVLSIYDSATETGPVVLSVALPATTFTPFSVLLDAECATGIFVGFDGTLANVGVTVSYR